MHNKLNFIITLFLLTLTSLACVDFRSIVPQSTTQPPPSATPATTPQQTPESVNENEKLLEKIEELEKKIDESEKKQTTPSPEIKKPTVPIIKDPKSNAQVNSRGDGFLAMRSQPNTETGYRVMKIPHGANVRVLGCQEFTERVSGRNGRWCRVSYAGKSGWVFDGWLVYK